MQRILPLALAALFLLVPSAAGQTQFFEVRVENVGTAYAYPSSGVFAVPEGAAEAGPIGPGGAYQFTVDAPPGASLTLATMFVHSNDLFYAPDGVGIALWNTDGTPVSGDVTASLQLWDAGTEVNQEPGLGADQAPRQAGPDTGATEGGVVQEVSDGFTYPAAADVLRVTVTPVADTRFTVRVENVSTAGTLMPSDGSQLAVPLAPGVWVVHTAPDPLFTAGQADRGEGLEALAEDGAAGGLGEALAGETGVTTVLSPGVWAVHTAPDPLFTSGQADRGEGLEAIAEDGSPGMLAGVLARAAATTGGAFAVPEGAAGPGAIGPGGAYRFTIGAMPGALLTLATMYVQSNDLFFAPEGTGIALWNTDGTPVSGDVTAALRLWDAGTEVNQQPGIGPDQAPRQAGPDTGATEGGMVQEVADGFTYPETDAAVRVTVTPLETRRFTVRVENVSTAGTLTPSDGSRLAVPLAPGVWVVHTAPDPLFTSDATDRGFGLEGLAEDGAAGGLGAALGDKIGFASGVFAVPEGAADAGPIGPGGAYQFTVDAPPGASLTLATMFVHSNDLFYAPDGAGIALWNADGTPVSGDVTASLRLWDAGTEVNQEPGLGADQAPRQAGPDTGATEGGVVQEVADGFTYPAAADVIRVTLMETPTSVDEDAPVPEGFALQQNYPNPFNPATTITFDMQQAGHARLSVYNVLGQKVADLFDGLRTAGTHRAVWDGTDGQGAQVSSGVYLYALEVAGTRAVRSMVLLR